MKEVYHKSNSLIYKGDDFFLIRLKENLKGALIIKNIYFLRPYTLNIIPVELILVKVK